MTKHHSLPYRLGTDVHSGHPITLTHKDRKQHFMVTGGSGTGKSFAMLHMLKQDLENPDCGACLLDPHGSLYDLLVQYISHLRPELAERVVLFDPANDTDHILGFNPFGRYARINPQFALNSFVAACLKTWGQYSTDLSPRITRWLENICAPLIHNGLTLAEVGFLLSAEKNNASRRELLRTLDNEFMLADWQNFEAVTHTQRDTILEGSQNRLRKFLRNHRLVRIFGQQERMLDMDRIIEEKKILLVNLRWGTELEEEMCRLLGVLLINDLYRAAILRTPEPVGKPHPFYCYIDEFYSFITRDLARSLDGTRKFGLFLRCAHQHLDQLRDEDDQLLGSMLGNCRAKMIFGSLGYKDAETLACQLFTDPDELLTVKHENVTTRYRPVEVPDVRVALSEGENETESESSTLAYSHATAVGQQLNRSVRTSRTVSNAQTQQQANTHGRSMGGSQARQTGTNVTATLTAGSSEGTDLSSSETEQHGTRQSHTGSSSRKESHSKLESLTAGNNTTMPLGDGAVTFSKSSGFNTQHSAAQSEEASQSDSAGTDHSRSRSSGLTRKQSNQQSESVARGSLENITDTTNFSRQDSTSEINGQTHTVATGEAVEESAGNSQVLTDTEQASRASASARGKSANRSVTVGVRNKMEEFTETTPVFWGLPEIRHRHTCNLMNQGLSEATLRIENQPPVSLRVDHVSIPKFDSRFSPFHTSLFRQDVIECFPEYYISWEDGTRAIIERQEALFRTSLSILRPKGSLSDPHVIEGAYRDQADETKSEDDDDDSESTDWAPFHDV